MEIKFNKYSFALLLGFIFSAIAYMWFTKSPYFESFSNWSQQNFVLFTIVLLTIKVIGIIWPPIPSGLFTLGAIPIIGWQKAYIIDLIGSLMGNTAAYYLGKNYGYNFMEKLFDDTTINRIKNFKIKVNRQIEAIFMLRIFTGSLLTEAIAYGAGVLRISFFNFTVGSLLSHMLVGIPVYYLTGNVFNLQNFTVGILIVLIGIPLLWKLKGRYIE